MLDLKKSTLTQEEIRSARLSVSGDYYHVYWERDEAVAKAQLAKALLGPRGIVAWLDDKTFDGNGIVRDWAAFKFHDELEAAATAAGLAWPMKGVE